MAWVWCALLLASTCLASDMQNTSSVLAGLSRCLPLNEDLVPMSLGPVDVADIKRVNRDCKVPMRHDGYLWHQVQEGLWFQATGSMELEDDKYTALSNRLECDPDSLNCAITVSSVVSVSASETWEASMSSTVGVSFKVEEVLTLQASTTEGSSHSATSSTSTASETSYTCSISGNHTVYLAARIQYYLIFGYVSEWVMTREFYIDDDGNIRERHVWRWVESCEPMFRIPKVLPDGSVAGTRRCVVEGLQDCPSYSQPPVVNMV